MPIDRNNDKSPGAPSEFLFQPGKSGNPGGLPKGVKEARKLALKHSKSAIYKLRQLMLKSPDERVQLAAAEAILDRAGCRPFSYEPEKIDLSSSDGTLADALLARLAALRAARGATIALEQPDARPALAARGSDAVDAGPEEPAAVVGVRLPG